MSWLETLRDLVGPGALDTFVGAAGVPDRPRVAPCGDGQWRAVLELARAERLRCSPLGAGSQLRPDVNRPVDLYLSTRQETGVVAYEPGDGTLTARAGTPWAELARTVAAGGHHLSPEFAPDAQHTLGGVIASGRSGFDRLRYGPLRHQVLGLRFLLADGTRAQSGGRLVKNVTGYDLHRLLTGSAGRLAVILEGSLRLAPEPARRRLLVGGFSDWSTLLAATRQLRELPLAPEALIARGASSRELELELHLAGRTETVAWELERARANVPSLGEPDDATARRARAVRDESVRGTPSPSVRIELRPSRLFAAVERLEPLLAAAGLAVTRRAHPWLATLTLDFQRPDPGALAEFARKLPGRLVELAAREHWSGTPATFAPSPPRPAVQHYGVLLEHSLDPASLFAGGSAHD